MKELAYKMFKFYNFLLIMKVNTQSETWKH